MASSPPFASSELLLVRHNPWIVALALSPLLLSVAALAAGLAGHTTIFAFVAHPIILTGVLLFVVWRRNPRPLVEQVEVRADQQGLQVGARHVPRAELREGFVVPGTPPRLLLRPRCAWPMELMVGSTEQGRALLRALGLDVTQTVARFRTLSRAVSKRRYMAGVAGAWGALLALFMGASAHGHHAPVAGVLLLSLIAMMTAFLVPAQLAVGADGVVLSWFGRKRFIGYGDLDSVARYEKGWGRSRHIGVVLTLRSGEEVFVPTGQAKWDDRSVALIEERIREAMEVFRGGGTSGEAALLRRADRTMPAWVASLRAVGAGANADLRTAPVPRERLFRIVEDPASPAGARAAAAVALGGDLDDQSRDRLRRAAEAIAAPRLRVAIEAAADADDAAIEEALAAVAAEDAKTRAR